MMAGDSSWPRPRSWHGLSERQRNFSNEVINMAAMYSSAVILKMSAHPYVANGSGFLIRLAGKQFLITNAHVLSAYYDIRARDSSAVFEFGGQVIDPNVVSIDERESVDVVVLNVTGIIFEQNRPSYWKSGAASLVPYSPESWPIDPAKPGEAVVTVGWPGDLRTRETSGGLEFAAFPMIGQFVDFVGDGWFSIPFERKDIISTDFDPFNPVALKSKLGGMSGSPVFALHRSGVVPIQLIGVIRTYGEGLDVLYCSRADLIGQDGVIRS
jgi:hypothetical protein